ncbi:MAG: nicotinate-nucleotide diphosphorylase, partial [Oscillospiraceae bacterium]
MDYIGLDKFILDALREDIGTGDITTTCCIPESAESVGTFKAKQEGIFCGTDVLIRVFKLLDERVIVTPLAADGDPVKKGQPIAKISGPSRSILSGERV